MPTSSSASSRYPPSCRRCPAWAKSERPTSWMSPTPRTPLAFDTTATSSSRPGARQVRKAMPEALLVFLAPPSVDELHRRQTGRGTEDPETVRLRREHAVEELAAESEFDVTVVNDSVERAADELLGLLGCLPLSP